MNLTPFDLAAQSAGVAAALAFARQGSLPTANLQQNLVNGQVPDVSSGYIAYGRSFGGGTQTGMFVDQLTVRETHRDEMVITEHPVALAPGPAPVSDHAYVRPAEVTIEARWSNSAPGNTSGSATYAAQVYAKLLKLRNERAIMTVYTGKRAYTSMLLPGIDIITEEASEFALVATLHFRQIIVTSVQNFSVTSDPTAQANPQSTQPPTDAGSTQTQTGNFNGLTNGWGPTQIPPSGATGGSTDDTFTMKDDPAQTQYTNPVEIPPLPPHTPGGAAPF